MRRWRRRVLCAGVLPVGLALLLGRGAPAGADPPGPPPPATCRITLHPDRADDVDFDRPVLDCDPGVPSSTPMPGVPAGCLPEEDGAIPKPDAAGAMPTIKAYLDLDDDEAVPPLTQLHVKCPKTGQVWVHCRDQDEFLGIDELNPDTEKDVQVSAGTPDWWRQAIADESKSAADGDGGQGCELAAHPPTAPCSLRDTTQLLPEESGLVPDQCWGTYPSSHYDFTFSDDGSIDFTKDMLGWTASFMFTIAKNTIVAVLWLVGWAFTFDITQYTSFAFNIGGAYDEAIIGPFGLKDIVWWVLIAWAGFSALRGKLGAAAGEIGVAILLAGVATVLFMNRAMYMNEIARAMDQTSASMLVAGRHLRCVPDSTPLLPGDRDLGRANCRIHEKLVKADTSRTPSLAREIRPLQQHLHQVFVEEPYSYINWGKVVTGPCLETENQIISTGFNGGGWPERHMARNPQCAEEATFNRDPTSQRMAASLLTLLVCLVVGFFLGLMALTVVISKFVIALLFALLPFAAVAAILPGGGRRLAWSWLGTLVQLFVAIVSMTFLLALMLLGVDEVLRATQTIALIQRWFTVLLVVGAVYFGRRRLLAGSKNIGENITDSMTRLTPAGAASRGSAKGVDMLGIDRGIGRAAWTGAVGAGVAGLEAARFGGRVAAFPGRVWMNRMAERRVARRGYRNLERMERTRERPMVEYRYDAYRFHPEASTPKSHGLKTPGGAPARAMGGGGRGHQPMGGPSREEPPVALGRERMEVVHRWRAPPPGLRHPIEHWKTRLRHGRRFGTQRQTERLARKLHTGEWGRGYRMPRRFQPPGGGTGFD